MTLKALMAIASTTKCVPIEEAKNVAEKLVSRINIEHPEEDNRDIYLEEYLDRDFSSDYAIALTDLSQVIISADSFDGDENNFHNLAVVYAKANYYSIACKILDIGLSISPNSIDLLADFLVYGIKCNRFSDCERYYKVLKEIPYEKWNWRAFDFSIDYLLAKQSNSYSKNEKKEIELLCDKFIKYLSNEDRAYLAKANVCAFFGRQKQEIAILEEATTKNEIRTPMCALRLARYYFKNGLFDKALVLLIKARNDNIEDQPSVNRGALFMISCLCNYAKFSLMYSGHDELREDETLLVLNAYQNFALSRKHNYQGINELKAYMDELELITNINNPYE